MALRTLEAPRDLLSRILETPDLARVVQSLEPAVLNQLVRKCGLEDCGPIVALATTDQLTRLFDDDLWRAGKAGGEEEFDADRFGLWLEVLAEAGADVAARRLVEMDFDFVTAALSRHVLVIDAQAMVLEWLGAELSEDVEPAEEALGRTEAALEDRLSFDVGGFKVVARRGESWDALLAVLASLDARHPAFFGRLMARCAFLSTEYIADNDGLYEVLTTDEQVLSDVAGERDDRREREGYVAPPLAVSFLKIARQRVADGSAPPVPDHVTVRYFRRIEACEREGPGPGSAPPARTEEPAAESTDRHVHELLATLRDEGVLPRSRAALLSQGKAGEGDRHSRIRGFLQQERAAAAQALRMEELGYLANVLVAGCSFQSRRLRPVEAADAVLAACNLGLESWPRHWPRAEDLVTAFRVGWSVAHEQLCLHAAQRLVEVVSHLKCDNADLRRQLALLGRRMQAQVEAGTPWRERDRLDVLATLDPPSWATLQGLVDECPVVPKRDDGPAARRRLRVTTEFEFVSENRQIAWARDFVASLPGRLAG